MQTSLTKKSHQFLIRYQCGLAVTAIFLFFTNLDVYLYRASILSLQPLYYILLFIIATIPLAKLLPLNEKILPSNLMRWCFAYILISLFAFWLYPSLDEPFQELKDRILSLSFMFATILVFSGNYIVQKYTRYAIIAVTLISIFNNIYEFLNPGVFAGLNLTGRAAGFYIDSNSSGDSLILGMIFGLGILPIVFRIPFLLLVGIGVFLTFSRGALLGYFIVIVILTITKVIPRKQLILWILGILVASIFLGQLGNIFNQVDTSFINGNVLKRLDDFTSFNSGSGDVEDDASAARKLVLKLGWERFLENPLIGNGLGSAQYFDVGALVSHEISTHNTYLYFMVDHGILGTFILPLIILSVSYPARGEGKQISLAFAMFVLLWGLFSHTILIQRLHLMTFSLMAIMNQTRSKNKSESVKLD